MIKRVPASPVLLFFSIFCILCWSRTRRRLLLPPSSSPSTRSCCSCCCFIRCNVGCRGCCLCRCDLKVHHFAPSLMTCTINVVSAHFPLQQQRQRQSKTKAGVRPSLPACLSAAATTAEARQGIIAARHRGIGRQHQRQQQASTPAAE